MVPISPQALLISPDGMNLYEIADSSYKILVYSRDPVSGELRLVQEPTSAFNTPCVPEPPGILCPISYRALTISPDGKYIYVSLWDDRRIGIFQRDPLTGFLTEVSDTGPDSVWYSRSMAVSADGAHLYAAASDSILVFQRDIDSGALSLINHFDTAGLQAVASVDLSADGANLYAAANQYLWVFQRDAATGLITVLESIPVNLTPHRLAVALSGDDAHVYLGDASGIKVFQRDALSGALTLSSMLDDFPGPDVLRVNSDGSGLFGLYGSHSIKYFARDAGTGAVTQVSVNAGECPSGAISAIAASPDPKSTYVGYYFAGILLSIDPGPYVGRVGRFKIDGDAQCGAVPQVGCTESDVSTLGITADIFSRSKLKWSWRSANASLPDLSDPTQGTDYVLCFYDDGGGSQALQWSASVPGGMIACNGAPAWSAVPGGWQMRQAVQNVPQGVARVKLAKKPGKPGLASLRGKGALLAPVLPSPSGTVVVQLLSNLGQCWSATYLQESVVRNDGRTYKAKVSSLP